MKYDQSKVHLNIDWWQAGLLRLWLMRGDCEV